MSYSYTLVWYLLVIHKCVILTLVRHEYGKSKQNIYNSQLVIAGLSMTTLGVDYFFFNLRFGSYSCRTHVPRYVYLLYTSIWLWHEYDMSMTRVQRTRTVHIVLRMSVNLLYCIYMHTVHMFSVQNSGMLLCTVQYTHTVRSDFRVIQSIPVISIPLGTAQKLA